jgi:hypothetical protein
MSLRYYVFLIVALLCVLYFSKEVRDILPARITGCLPDSLSPSPRHEAYLPPTSVEGNKTELDKWIQSRLTQQGLKEMTESGHWQSEHSMAL